MKKSVSLLGCWIAALVSLTAVHQQPSASFRAGVDVVQLDVSVLDNNRRPVRGLTAADFTILDDEEPREIVSFSAVELPALPATTPSGVDTVSPDVIRNDTPSGRLVVIMLDPYIERVMVSARVTIADPPGLTALRATARRIVDLLGPGDLGAVGHAMYGTPQNFTSDKARLKRAIDSSAFGTIKEADGAASANCICGVCRLEAITRVASTLSDVTGRRKAVFFIGERIQMAPVPGTCNTYLEPATRKMLQATQLANVTVHAVDPNSLETTNVHAGDDFSPTRPISEAAKEQEEKNRAFLLERHATLRSIADWTGGRAILNTNAPQESVRPILEESAAYYLLAFKMSDVKLDGRFHPITVKVNRPDVQVRTRKGYYAEAMVPAPPAAATSTLEDVTRRLLPERGVAMSVAAAPFRGSAGMPVIVVATGVSATVTRQQESELERVEILTSAIRDGQDSAEWQRQRFTLTMPTARPGELQYESIATLTVKPGQASSPVAYEVRVATRQERADVVGSVHALVDVPDFDSDALSLSGLVLFDRNAPTVTPVEALGGVLGAPPTTRRDFAASDAISAFARVYQKRSAAPAAVVLTFRVLDAGLNEVTATRVTLSADQFAANGADARYTVPINTLKPGAYVLRLDAASERAVQRRELRFSVK